MATEAAAEAAVTQLVGYALAALLGVAILLIVFNLATVLVRTGEVLIAAIGVVVDAPRRISQDERIP